MTTSPPRRTFVAFAASLLATVACSSGSASSSSSGGANSSGGPEDAATAADGGPIVHGNDAGGDGGMSAAERMTLTIDGANVLLDQTSVTIDSRLEGGAHVTKLRARIVNAETYGWNEDKVPAYVQLDDMQLDSVPHPLGDIRCVRSAINQQYMMISITTANGTPLKSTDASCTARVDTWADGSAYRGNAKGLVTGSGTYAFTFAWNVTK